MFNKMVEVETDCRSKAYFVKFTRRLYKSGPLGQLDPANYSDDVHLSAQGAGIVARAIFRRLQFLPK